MELFREISEAWSQRLRSPFIGSIAISFFLVNWQPIWFLLFADKPVEAKFLFFNSNTSAISLYLLPIVIGSVIAWSSPWLRLIGATIARSPTKQLREMQIDEAHGRKIREIENETKRVHAEAALQAAKENVVIAEAKRVEAAQAISPNAVESLEKERAEQAKKKTLRDLNEIQGQPDEHIIIAEKLPSSSRQLLTNMASLKDDGLNIVETDDGRSANLGSFELINTTSNRDWMNFELDVENLKGLELISETRLDYYEVTKKGYQIADLIMAAGLK